MFQSRPTAGSHHRSIDAVAVADSRGGHAKDVGAEGAAAAHPALVPAGEAGAPRPRRGGRRRRRRGRRARAGGLGGGGRAVPPDGVPGVEAAAARARRPRRGSASSGSGSPASRVTATGRRSVRHRGIPAGPGGGAGAGGGALVVGQGRGGLGVGGGVGQHSGAKVMTMSPASGSPAFCMSTRISRSPSLTRRWIVPGVNHTKRARLERRSPRSPPAVSVCTAPRPGDHGVGLGAHGVQVRACRRPGRRARRCRRRAGARRRWRRGTAAALTPQSTASHSAAQRSAVPRRRRGRRRGSGTASGSPAATSSGRPRGTRR